MTPQEKRDQDYLEGYGVGLSHTLTHAELVSHTVAFGRGYRDAVWDRQNVKAPEWGANEHAYEGGEPA